jgi:lipopolysaccharide biosynthesis glycosyltransferase
MIATRCLDHLAAVRLPEEDVPVPIAAARDLGAASRRTGFSRVVAGRPYFNAGLLVIRPSLAAFEEIARAVDKVPTLSLPYAEQDLLNDFVAVNLVELPVAYNCQVDKLGDPTYEAEIDAACGIGSPPAVFHFCGPKPWRTLPPHAYARDALHANPRATAFKTRSAQALDMWWAFGKDAFQDEDFEH